MPRSFSCWHHYCRFRLFFVCLPCTNQVQVVNSVYFILGLMQRYDRRPHFVPRNSFTLRLELPSSISRLKAECVLHTRASVCVRMWMFSVLNLFALYTPSYMWCVYGGMCVCVCLSGLLVCKPFLPWNYCQNFNIVGLVHTIAVGFLFGYHHLFLRNLESMTPKW